VDYDQNASMSDDKEVNPYEPPKSELMVKARRISYAVVVLVLLSMGMCGFGVFGPTSDYRYAPLFLLGAGALAIGAGVVYLFWFIQEYRRLG
jgi:hypothetical protein